MNSPKDNGASEPQNIITYSEPKSLLLTAPNNIIFELFDTIIKRIPDEILLSFIRENLKDYLKKNWSNKITQHAIGRLRREQAVEIKTGLSKISNLKNFLSSTRKLFVKRKLSTSDDGKSSKSSNRLEIKQQSQNNVEKKNPPLDCDKQSSSNDSNKNKPLSSIELSNAIDQIYNLIIWRIENDNVTQITSLIIKLALNDAYKGEKLIVESYEDVVEFFETSRSKLLIKLYSFGDAPANDQKLLLSKTTQGDLTKWIANYIDGSEKKHDPDLLKKLASALRDKTKNCFYLTNDIADAIASLQTNSIRCSIVIDRFGKYSDNNANLLIKFPLLESMMKLGKLYVLSSLNCIEFSPDPTAAATCC